MNRNSGERVRWIAASLTWMGAIFFISSQPVPELANEPLLDLILKKLAHAAAYAILAILLALALDGDRRGRPRPWVPPASVSAFLIAAGYAVTDEIHQAFVPTRHASPLDVLIDALGAGIAMLLLGWMHRSGSRRTSD